jgi:hypothetical protein
LDVDVFRCYENQQLDPLVNLQQEKGRLKTRRMLSMDARIIWGEQPLFLRVVCE